MTEPDPDFDPASDPISGLARFPLHLDRPWIGISAAVVFSAVAYFGRAAIDPWLPPGFPYVTFFPAIVVVAFLFGLRAGLIAAVLGFALSWYFFIPPIHSFALTFGSIVALGLYVFVVGIDLALIGWLQSSNRQLSQQREICARLAANRETLFRELQHRVGNNLQTISSLLALQRTKIADREARAELDEAVRRIGLIGRVQRSLYLPDGEPVGLGPMIRTTASGVIETTGRDDIALEIVIPGELALLPDQAIPVALVVAEAVANAIEHGFPDEPGRIAISAERTGADLALRIADDGRGPPADFGAHSASLGIKIAESFARTLKGRFTVTRDDRAETVSLLSFPLDA